MEITWEFMQQRCWCSGRNHQASASEEFKWADFFGRQISQQPLCLMGVATLQLGLNWCCFFFCVTRCVRDRGEHVLVMMMMMMMIFVVVDEDGWCYCFSLDIVIAIGIGIVTFFVLFCFDLYFCLYSCYCCFFVSVTILIVILVNISTCSGSSSGVAV